MKKLSFLLLTLVALGGCKKDDNNTPGMSPTELLTAKNWRVSTFSVTAAGQPYPAVLDPCDKDNYLKFNTDKTLIVDEGPTKCDPTNAQTEKGTWSMPSADKLTITAPNLPVSGGTFDIKELSATTLHLYISDSQSGTPLTADVTLTAF
ncbi:lipocalin family protein [Hymenobacter sp. H14-R3]|uniref:lipocalin family protein n=1 Tax=Hymenobacter sp. H14-R3 TaxID=3046308 RepID=UPI0024B8ABC0|nr:lipocalin family protein [Hymenobacter sp. H14-R3]MDJ0366204.1 lipocalin family protein [Hymenobacter sp. H14-R3]